MVKGHRHQEESLSIKGPILHPIPLLVSDIPQPGGDGSPRDLSETRAPTLGPTHPLAPDLEGGPDLIQVPGACLGLEVCPGPDPDLGPFLDPDQEQDPGIDPGLCLRPERGVCPDPQGREELTSSRRTP